MRLLTFLAMTVVLYGPWPGKALSWRRRCRGGSHAGTCSISSFWLFEGLLVLGFVGPAIASLAIGRELLASARLRVRRSIPLSRACAPLATERLPMTLSCIATDDVAVIAA